MSDPTERLNAALADRYRIERKIGEGGMASVYLAEDLKHERQVALKILRPELAAVIGAERFLAEIKTTANLQHPHILPLFDSGEADGFLYYVMPYIAGENLRDRIQSEGQLGVDEAVRIARDVGEALDYAHRNDIIHRDIKPANILLHDGNPLVADFGIALAVSAAGGGRMTETGLSLGTPHYMSPEQASADRDLNARSDVYSLGCVLYEMLAGHPPHTGPSAQSVLVRILTEDPRPVSEVRRSVPPHVAAAVTKAIEKLPADRFESAREFVDALGDPGFTHVAAARAAPGPGTRAPSASTEPRSRLTAVVPWAVAAVFAALAGWSVLSAPEAPSVTTTPMDLGGREPVASFTGLDFTVAANGSVFALNHGVDGESRIAVRRSSDRDYRMLAGTGDAHGLTLSPPGDWVAYWSSDLGLVKVPTAGGDPQPVVPNESAGTFRLTPLDWGEDGSILFLDTSQNPDAVRIVPHTGGESRVVYDGRAPSGQILPGGNVVLGVDGPDASDRGVRFVDVARDTSRVVVPGGIHPRYANGHLLWADENGTVRASGFDPATGVLDEDQGIVLEGVTIVENQWARYDVSENGTLVYSIGGSSETSRWLNQRLVTVTLDGTVTEEEFDPRFIRDPVVWSPGGRYVAYQGAEPGAESDESGLYIYDMELKDRPTRLTGDPIGWGLAWSPDESRIAFTMEPEEGQRYDIYVTDRDGNTPATLLFTGEDPFQVVWDWIPEDQMLINNGRDPWILNLPAEGSADAADGRPFFQSEHYTFGVSLGPRREWVAYNSPRSGQEEVYVRSFPEAGPPVQISAGGGRLVYWSPEGDVIYYFRRQNGSDHLWAARIDRGPPIEVVRHDSLTAWPYELSRFVRWEVDLHPDGDRFIGVRPAEETGDEDEAAEPVRYFIVTNWFEEMRERMGGGG